MFLNNKLPYLGLGIHCPYKKLVGFVGLPICTFYFATIYARITNIEMLVRVDLILITLFLFNFLPNLYYSQFLVQYLVWKQWRFVHCFCYNVFHFGFLPLRTYQELNVSLPAVLSNKTLGFNSVLNNLFDTCRDISRAYSTSVMFFSNVMVLFEPWMR